MPILLVTFNCQWNLIDNESRFAVGNVSLSFRCSPNLVPKVKVLCQLVPKVEKLSVMDACECQLD